MRCHIGYELVDCEASGLVVHPVDTEQYVFGGGIIFIIGAVMFGAGLCLQSDGHGGRNSNRRERLIGQILAWSGTPLALAPVIRLVMWWATV